MKYKVVLLAIVLSLLLQYVAFSVMIGEFAIMEWNKFTRVLFVIAEISLAIYILIQGDKFIKGGKNALR